eukprot:scaffold64145_cov68-Phaeocystis_antarctica.AAC.1
MYILPIRAPSVLAVLSHAHCCWCCAVGGGAPPGLKRRGSGAVRLGSGAVGSPSPCPRRRGARVAVLAGWRSSVAPFLEM